MTSDRDTILEQVKALHEAVGFKLPPLDLRAVLAQRPGLEWESGAAESPLELCAEGEKVKLIVPEGGDAFEQRMRLAHGLGHVVLHEPPHLCSGTWPEEELSLDTPDATEGLLRERQAHLFALELLVPLELVEMLTNLRVTLFMKGEEVDQEVERLAPLFKAPPDAVRARLYLMMDRAYRLFSGRPPRKI